MTRPDLDNAAAIDRLVDAFYARVLADPTLAPVFTEVAAIDLDTHLPRIKAFWRKMLLGEAGYRRNMVARHAAVHARFGLGARHFDRWLALFTRTLDERFAGPYAARARHLAVTIARNLARNLDTCDGAAARRANARDHA
ncbi:MAG: group III truncated hemoglobin [Halofilum sp. (in: g-proteobacteria)]|nr:group III truncated hemoglobin [Halofilum sp. (in: g-proteobacteria)]